MKERIDIVGQNGNTGEHYTELGQSDPQQLPLFPHEMDDSYAAKIEKVYELEKDGMFVDDYAPRGHDMISSPNHYMLGKPCFEVIEVIKAVLGSDEALDWLSPYEGGQYTGVIERILRAPKKDQLQDLKKAHKQLGWLIESLEK